jgi:uncharacterized protein with HEPN domain
MMRHDPMVSVHHMLDHAREAAKMARGRGRADLDTDRMLNLSLVRLVEIIGEAATRVPEEFRGRHAGVPWRETVGMRNRLIHGYDTVDFDILWTIIQGDLPPLIAQLEGVGHRDR